MVLLVDDEEDAGESAPSTLGILRAVAVACWASVRFRVDVEAVSEEPCEGSKCMSRRRLCRRTKARRIEKSKYLLELLLQRQAGRIKRYTGDLQMWKVQIRDLRSVLVEENGGL